MVSFEKLFLQKGSARCSELLAGDKPGEVIFGVDAVQVDDQICPVDEYRYLGKAFPVLGEHVTGADIHEVLVRRCPLDEAVSRLARKPDVEGEPPIAGTIPDVADPNVSSAAGDVGKQQGSLI